MPVFFQAQVGLLVILVVAIIDFMLGTFIGPKSDEEKAKGFVGYDSKYKNCLSFYFFLYLYILRQQTLRLNNV